MAITGIDTLDGKQIIAAGASSAIKAAQDGNGNIITATYQTTTGMSDYATTASVTGKQDALTFGYTDNQISQINGSAIYSQGGGGGGYTGNVQQALDTVYSSSGTWDTVTAKLDAASQVVTATGGTTTYVQTVNGKNISATNAGSALSATDAYNLTNTAIKVDSATSANAALAANTATYASNNVALTSIYNSGRSGYAASAYINSNVTGKITNWNAATSAVTANSASWAYPSISLWSDYDVGTAFFGTGINIGDNVNIKFKPGNFMTYYTTGTYRVASMKLAPGQYSVTASLKFNNITASQWTEKSNIFTVTNGHIVSGPHCFNCFPEWGNEPWIQLVTESNFTTALNSINRNIRNSTSTDNTNLIISFNTIILNI